MSVGYCELGSWVAEVTLEKVIDMCRGLGATESRLESVEGNVSNINCICWHPQMKIFAVGCNDSSIVVYSCPLGSWCCRLQACPYGNNIMSVCFHPTEPLLFAIVTGDQGTYLTVWT